MAETTFSFIALSVGLFILLSVAGGIITLFVNRRVGYVALVIFLIMFVFFLASAASPLTEKQLARIYKERELCVQVQILDAIEKRIQLTASEVRGMQDKVSKKFCADLLKDKEINNPLGLTDEYISNFYSLI